MKVYLYINKKGFKENTFRIAFKELVKIGAEGTQSNDNMYLVGKYEARDNNNSFDVPYNKKYENRYFAIPINDREKGFFNLTTILCNNDLSDYEVINEATLNGVINTLYKDADESNSESISLEYVGGHSKETQNIIGDISSSRFIAMINMLNTWASEEKQDVEFKLQIDF